MQPKSLDVCFTIEDNILTKFSGDVPSVFIPDGVECISERVFFRKGNIKSIFIPDSVKEIGRLAFYSMTGLSELRLPSSLVTIGEDACAMLCVREINIPDGVKVIPKGALLETAYCDKDGNITFDKVLGISAGSVYRALRNVYLSRVGKKCGEAVKLKSLLVELADNGVTSLCHILGEDNIFRGNALKARA